MQHFMMAASAAHAESAGEFRSEEAAVPCKGPLHMWRAACSTNPEPVLGCNADLVLSCNLLLVISCDNILLLDLLDGHRAGRPCACFLGLQVKNGCQLQFFSA